MLLKLAVDETLMLAGYVRSKADLVLIEASPL